VTTEFTSDLPFSSTATLLSPVVGPDLSSAPGLQNVQTFQSATVGLTWQARNGVFIGGGLSWNLPTKDRSGLSIADTDVTGDFVDYQVRLGYHPGVKQFVPIAPPAKCEDPKALNYNGPAPCQRTGWRRAATARRTRSTTTRAKKPVV
jgi:hypothetical protein